MDFVDARGLREMGIATGRARGGMLDRALAALRGRAASAEGRERQRQERRRDRPDRALKHVARDPSAWLAAQALAGQLREARSAGEGRNLQQRLRRQLARKLRTLRREGKLNEMRRLYPEEFKGIIDGIGRGGLHR